MQFSDFPFPAGTALFPSHVVVKEYLHRYAEDLRDLIKFQTLVLDVSVSARYPRIEWTVTWRDLQTNQVSEAKFDAVIVANGHHNDPNVPVIPGLAEWDQMYPGSVIHSSLYRRADSFTSKVCEQTRPGFGSRNSKECNRKLSWWATPPLALILPRKSVKYRSTRY